MEKIGGIVCGQGRERLLQFGAEQCLPILVVRHQRLKIRIPQMELHGGILHRDVDPGVTDGLTARKGRKEAVRLPAERRGQLSLQAGDVHGSAVCCQQRKVIPAVSAVGGHCTAVRLGKKLL